MSDEKIGNENSVTAITLPNKIIMHKGEHANSYIAATGANVLALVKKAVNSSTRLKNGLELIAQKENEPVFLLRSHFWLWRAMLEILDHKQDGSDTRYLGRMFIGKPEIAIDIQEDWRRELLLWMMDSAFPGKKYGSASPREEVQRLAGLDDADDDELALTKRAYLELSFLAPARDRLGPNVSFISNQTYDQCDEAKSLLKDRWKAEAISDEPRAYHIISRYVRFLNELEEGFSIEDVSEDVFDFEFNLC